MQVANGSVKRLKKKVSTINEIIACTHERSAEFNAICIKLK